MGKLDQTGKFDKIRFLRRVQMDPVRNPFAPGAGTPSPELAGRAMILDELTVTLQRIALGKFAQPVPGDW